MFEMATKINTYVVVEEKAPIQYCPETILYPRMREKFPDHASLKDFLDEKVDLYNRKEFIEDDPIQIPHQFTKSQDIEIAGFFAATLAWGQRRTIISKCRELMALMENAPHAFVTGHQES